MLAILLQQAIIMATWREVRVNSSVRVCADNFKGRIPMPLETASKTHQGFLMLPITVARTRLGTRWVEKIVQDILLFPLPLASSTSFIYL